MHAVLVLDLVQVFELDACVDGDGLRGLDISAFDFKVEVDTVWEDVQPVDVDVDFADVFPEEFLAP